MSADKIMTSIWQVLANDAGFLSLLGLDPATATNADKAKKIQKNIDPDGLATTNIPLCCLYPTPGTMSRRNTLVYDSQFQLTFFAADLHRAMQLGEAAQKLLTFRDLTVPSIGTFEIQFISEYASSSGVAGIKRFDQRFSVSEIF